MRFRNNFQSNCMSFKFSLDNSHRQSFIFWSSIRGTQHAQTFLINRCSRKIVLTVCPQRRLSAAHWLDDFAIQYFQHYDSFLHRQLQTDVPTSSHLQGFLPWWNSAAQRLTVAYDAAHSPYTTVIRLCICCGGTFCSVRNSISAR